MDIQLPDGEGEPDERSPRTLCIHPMDGDLGFEEPADMTLYTVVLEMDLSDVFSHFGAFK